MTDSLNRAGHGSSDVTPVTATPTAGPARPRWARLATPVVAAVLAAGLAAPAQAALSPDYLSVADLKGTWVGSVAGWVDGEWTTTQARIVWSARKGASARGALSLRPCAGREQACQTRSPKGDWGVTERVQVAVMSDGTVAGRSETLTVLGFAQGDGSLEVTLTPYRIVDTADTVHYGRLVRAG